MTASDTPRFPSPGERHQGTLRSPLSELGELELPYFALTGRADGPLTTILAGVHGCEYVSIRAATRLAREIDPGSLTGRLLVVPIMNLPSFWERVPFVCPRDGKNPNRVFPGTPDGTYSEQLAHFVFSTCIRPAQALLDLHGGDMVEELLPFAIYAADAAPDVTARSRDLAAAFGLPYTIAKREEPGALGGMTYAAAARAGVPGIIAEAGGIGQLTRDDVELLMAGARRALHVQGHFKGAIESPGTTELESFDWVYSKVAGFWTAAVRAGDEVTAGQLLGQVLDLYGEPREAIHATRNGVVIFRTTSAAVREQGLLLGIGS